MNIDNAVNKLFEFYGDKYPQYESYKEEVEIEKDNKLFQATVEWEEKMTRSEGQNWSETVDGSVEIYDVHVWDQNQETEVPYDPRGLVTHRDFFEKAQEQV